jgi:hypothetical protein
MSNYLMPGPFSARRRDGTSPLLIVKDISSSGEFGRCRLFLQINRDWFCRNKTSRYGILLINRLAKMAHRLLQSLGKTGMVCPL